MAVELTTEIYGAVLDSLPMGVYIVDRKRQIALWNAAAEKLTGYLRQEVVGRSCWDGLLMHCDENNTVLCGVACPLLHTMHDGLPREADVFLRHKGGQRIRVRIRASPLRNEDGSIIGAVESFEEPPAADAHGHGGGDLSIDDVTEMPDHQAMQKRVQAAADEFAATSIPFGILSMTVDNLDFLRRTYGRRAVNAILYVTAKTLSKNFGADGMVGRWPEDGFLAIVPDCQAAALVKSAEMLKKLIRLTGVPWWGDRLSVAISAGGAIMRAGDTPESLAKRAEAALQAGLREDGDHVVVA